MKRILEVDAYIAKSPEFARPILERIRESFHAASPDIQEAMKWQMPHFVRNGILGGMAAFKQHVRFGLWRGKEIRDPNGRFDEMGESGMAAMKITSLADLPAKKALVAYIKEAVALDDKPKPSQTRKESAKRPAPSPPRDLLAALARNSRALATYQALSPSHQREYVEWITEAKREATREKRIAQAVEWMAEGKPRNWRYMN
jgi:uncharacterized protein YdeI (YjbR/CyaY-like superfamily)